MNYGTPYPPDLVGLRSYNYQQYLLTELLQISKHHKGDIIFYRNIWLGNTIVVIHQICWTQGHVDLTVYNITWFMVEYVKQI